MEGLDHGDALRVAVEPGVIVRPTDVNGLRVVDATPGSVRLGICPVKVLGLPDNRDGAEAAPEVLVVSRQEQRAAGAAKAGERIDVPPRQRACRVRPDKPDLVVCSFDGGLQVAVIAGGVVDGIACIVLVQKAAIMSSR